MDDDILRALIKKAKGYETKEVIDEFVVDESSVPILSKRKVTYKDIPPDISAAKTLAEFKNAGGYGDFTEDELKKEKERLLRELASLSGEDGVLRERKSTRGQKTKK
ncbi:MAG: hypothetical protein LBQ27_03325 [Clostridiales bacterium]|nr:hypothetical protein [Clostridiales bacterium]